MHLRLYVFFTLYPVTKHVGKCSDKEYIMSATLCRSTQIKMYSWDNAQVVLVGNKCDAEDERVISTERGKYLADSLGRTVVRATGKRKGRPCFTGPR